MKKNIKNNQNKKNGDNIMNKALIVIAVLIVVFGGYLLFFKTKGNEEIAINDVKLDLVNKVTGQSGDLYLDKNGKVYLSLTNLLQNSNLSAFVKRFAVSKNDVYNQNTLDAILLNVTNVTKIDYVGNDLIQDSHYLLTTKNGKEVYIYDYAILQDKIINLVDNEEYNTAVDNITKALAYNIGADDKSIDAAEVTVNVNSITVKINGTTSEVKMDGDEVLLYSSGTQTKASEFVAKSVEVVKTDKQSQRSYADLGTVVNITEHVDSKIDDTYGVKGMKKYMEDHNITLDTIIYGDKKMPTACNCQGYSGYKDEDYNVCRDVTGHACWTPDDGYLNPFLPPIPDGSGNYSDTQRADISELAHSSYEKNKSKVEDAVKSKETKWWVYWNGSLSVSNPGKGLSNADTGCEKDRLGDNSCAGYTCYGTAEYCQKIIKNNKDKLGLTDADINRLFTDGRKADYIDPLCYSTDEESRKKGENCDNISNTGNNNIIEDDKVTPIQGKNGPECPDGTVKCDDWCCKKKTSSSDSKEKDEKEAEEEKRQQTIKESQQKAKEDARNTCISECNKLSNQSYVSSCLRSCPPID